MGLGSFIIGLFLLGLAIALLIGFAWTIMRPLLGQFRGTRESSGKVRKFANRLARIDQLIENEKQDEALKQLRKAVLLDCRLNETALKKLKEHHQNLLSRCLTLAEKFGSRAENIAETEHLLMQRIELQSLLLKANDSFSNIKSRRQQAGKELPNWSKTDFETRIKDIQSELKKNETQVHKALDELFSSLAIPSEENIVYH